MPLLDIWFSGKRDLCSVWDASSIIKWRILRKPFQEVFVVSMKNFSSLESFSQWPCSILTKYVNIFYYIENFTGHWSCTSAFSSKILRYIGKIYGEDVHYQKFYYETSNDNRLFQKFSFIWAWKTKILNRIIQSKTIPV